VQFGDGGLNFFADNAFHCFEHASHVTMSVVKLLTRIVAPDVCHTREVETAQRCAALLRDFSFGIASDPLVQFACVFAAIIHDVDHTGVPNQQLIVEDQNLAALYNNKSVAERNSIDLAWSLLMKDEFTEFRHCIAPTSDELQRFRQLVENIVLATDIMDPELKKSRNERWELAFSSSHKYNGSSTHDDVKTQQEQINRKATIVIEHLIQASDIAHTMQHWHVYRKWNERLFREMYQAYVDGRSTVDPSTFWYEGELKFFDFYVIPLAKKLTDCGVFGVSSVEYLGYATKNRREWEFRGELVVSEMCQRLHTTDSSTILQSSPRSLCCERTSVGSVHVFPLTITN
jgi:hypothetical protein